MAENFAADCITQTDYLINKWFPTQQLRSPTIVTPHSSFLYPREMSFPILVCICFLVSLVTVVVVMLCHAR